MPETISDDCCRGGYARPALWYLYNDARLSASAGAFIDQAARGGSRIGISSISLAEVVYLVEKKRVPPSTYTDLESALDDPAHAFTEIPCTKAVIRAMRAVPRSDVPDMPDRLIAATAASLGVPVLSRDGTIRSSSVETIW